MNDTQKPSEEWEKKFDKKFSYIKETDTHYYNPWLFGVKQFVKQAIQATREETIQEMIKKIDDECEMLYREDMNAKVATLYRKASDIRTPCYIAGMNMAKKIINGSQAQKKEIEGGKE